MLQYDTKLQNAHGFKQSAAFRQKLHLGVNVSALFFLSLFIAWCFVPYLIDVTVSLCALPSAWLLPDIAPCVWLLPEPECGDSSEALASGCVATGFLHVILCCDQSLRWHSRLQYDARKHVEHFFKFVATSRHPVQVTFSWCAPFCGLSFAVITGCGFTSWHVFLWFRQSVFWHCWLQ